MLDRLNAYDWENVSGLVEEVCEGLRSIDQL
jgi:hypothetical protein